MSPPSSRRGIQCVYQKDEEICPPLREDDGHRGCDMTIFIWKNQEKTGEIEAESIEQAKEQLTAYSIYYTSLRKKWFYSNKIPKKNIYLFFERFAYLLHAHIPILTVLKIIQSDIQHPAFFRLISSIQQYITEGHTLHDALLQHPNHFSSLTCELIQLGESSGKLNDALSELVVQQKRMAVIKKTILKSLFYPVFLIFMAFIITLGLLYFVVPEFSQFYESMGASLPKISILLLSLSSFLQQQGFLSFNIFILFSSSLLLLIKHSIFLQKKLAVWSLRVPILGNLLQIIFLLRALRALTLLLSSGMPILSALMITIKITHHPVYVLLFQDMQEKIQQGFPMSNALSHHPYIPILVIELIKTGEETGHLTSMLAQAVALYEEILHEKIHALQILIEPLLIFFLSLIICFILLALYLPIFNIGNVV